MQPMLSRLVPVLFVLATGGSSPAGAVHHPEAALTAASADQGRITREYREQLQLAVDSLISTGVPGIVVHVRDGTRTLTLTGGVRDVATGLPMRRSDRFRIASITKSFVATALLRLEAEGKLSIDDTVEHWLPGAIPNGSEVTIRQLLNHTSGLFNYTNDLAFFYGAVLGDPLREWTPHELLAVANSHPPTSAPGETHHYSNTNYIVAGLILEAVTGTSVAETLARDTFKPLRLRHTTFEQAPQISGRFAHGYWFGRDLSVFTPSWAWAAGAIASNAEDVARFYRALLGGRLLAKEQLQEMETFVPAGFAADPVAGYGLGIRGETHTFFSGGSPHVTCGPGAWGHGGDFFGYFSLALNTRDASRQVVLLINDNTLVLFPSQLDALTDVIESAWCGLFS
jgi:D-alanyl-D-alanine carboxypeptidase